ncbi:MAG: hypothetical protein ACRDF4_10000 [Rhabdochlamydiaceae bacterium]
MKDKKQNSKKRIVKKKFPTRRIIGISVLLIAVLWAAVAYEMPLSWYGNWFLPQAAENVQGKNYKLFIPNASEPAITYSANFSFTSIGDFAIGNRIHVVATVYDVNTSDFLNHFIALIFLYQFTPYGSKDNPASAKLAYFSPVKAGVWRAEGNFYFEFPINFTGPVLLPASFSGIPALNMAAFYSAVQSQVEGYHFPFSVQPQSSTDQIISQLYSDRFQMTVFGSIGLLILDGILVGIVLNKDE